MVDTGGDESLKRVGHTVGRAVARPALEEHANCLLDEERVPLSPLERLLRKRSGSFAGRPGQLVEELLDELRTLRYGERLELDRGRAHAPPSPAGTCVEELGPRQTENENGRANPVREMLDQVEERR